MSWPVHTSEENMTTIEYTKSYDEDYDFTSSLVQSVRYNENDSSVAIELNDNYYRYTNVPLDAVEDLVNADSVGVHYNTVFKRTYGPGENLGPWYDVRLNEVPATAYVGKDFESAPVGKDFITISGEGVTLSSDGSATFTNEPTREYSLTTPSAASADSPTKEYSLKTPEPEPLDETLWGSDETVKSTVFFTIDGGEKIYEFASEQTDLVDAIAEVNDYVSVLGAKGKVVRVVFDFE